MRSATGGAVPAGLEALTPVPISTAGGTVAAGGAVPAKVAASGVGSAAMWAPSPEAAVLSYTPKLSLASMPRLSASLAPARTSQSRAPAASVSAIGAWATHCDPPVPNVSSSVGVVVSEATPAGWVGPRGHIERKKTSSARRSTIWAAIMSGPTYGRRVWSYLPSLTESCIAPQTTFTYGRRAAGAAAEACAPSERKAEPSSLPSSSMSEKFEFPIGWGRNRAGVQSEKGSAADSIRGAGENGSAKLGKGRGGMCGTVKEWFPAGTGVAEPRVTDGVAGDRRGGGGGFG